MEKILDIQEILVSIREDDQQLEKLIDDLKKEKSHLPLNILPRPSRP